MLDKDSSSSQQKVVNYKSFPRYWIIRDELFKTKRVNVEQRKNGGIQSSLCFNTCTGRQSAMLQNMRTHQAVNVTFKQ